MHAAEYAEAINRHAEECSGSLDDIREYTDIGMCCESCGRVLVESTPRQATEVRQADAVDPITANLPAVSGDQIVTPDEVSQRIADTVGRLERGAVFHRSCIEQKYTAELEYEKAWARAMLRADGSSADLRKAQAIQACEEELDRKVVAECRVKAVAATMHDLRAMLSGYQSMGKSIASTYGAADQAYGRGPY